MPAKILITAIAKQQPTPVITLDPLRQSIQTMAGEAAQAVAKLAKKGVEFTVVPVEAKNANEERLPGAFVDQFLELVKLKVKRPIASHPTPMLVRLSGKRTEFDQRGEGQEVEEDISATTKKKRPVVKCVGQLRIEVL